MRLVRAIKIVQGPGFSLAEIEQIIRSAENGDAGERLRVLADAKLVEIDERIEALRASQTSLEALLEHSCTSLTDCTCPPECPVSPDSARTERR